MEKAFDIVLKIIRTDFLDAGLILGGKGPMEELAQLLNKHKLISYFVSMCKEDIIMQNEELKESWIANVRQHNVAKSTVLQLQGFSSRITRLFAVAEFSI